MTDYPTDPSLASLVDRANLDRTAMRRHLAHGFDGADDGEFYLEYRQT
jgi:hypothetical protein